MALLVYAAKFICGSMSQPTQPNEEGPVEPGSYATAINIHNPNPREGVSFAKKAVLLFSANEKEEGFEVPKPPSKQMGAQLGPDFGMEIDGRDIRQELLSGQPVPAPVFIKGWVVIESQLPLDVVAVYTVRGPNGEVSIAVDRVPATQV